MPFCDRPDIAVHYEVGGDGPPLLLLNGLVASGFLWPRAWLERFQASYTVIRPSNRGTGHTPLGEAMTLDLVADDALAVLDECGGGPARLLGFSMGGMIAQTIALAVPDQVTRLVLCSTTTGGVNDVHPEFLAALAGAGGDATESFGSFLHLLTAPGFWDRDPATVADLATAWQAAPTPPETTLHQLGAAAMFDSRERLRDLSIPALVLHGTDDRLIVPAGGERVAAALPGARLEIFEDVGHMLPFEATERAGDLIADFLA